MTGMYGRHRRSVARSNWLLWPTPQAIHTTDVMKPLVDGMGSDLRRSISLLKIARNISQQNEAARLSFCKPLVSSKGLHTHLASGTLYIYWYGHHRRSVARSN